MLQGAMQGLGPVLWEAASSNVSWESWGLREVLCVHCNGGGIIMEEGRDLRNSSNKAFLASSVFGWFAQGLEKVMPHPVNKATHGGQVRRGGVRSMAVIKRG